MLQFLSHRRGIYNKFPYAGKWKRTDVSILFGVCRFWCVRRTSLFLRLTKCQTKVSTVSMLAPKYELVDFVAFSGDSQNTLCYGFNEKGIHITHWNWIGVHPAKPAHLNIAFYYLLMCWHGTSSGEWNSVFLRFIFQRFDFRAWNNRVWRMKLYCLTRQTILFG